MGSIVTQERNRRSLFGTTDGTFDYRIFRGGSSLELFTDSSARLKQRTTSFRDSGGSRTKEGEIDVRKLLASHRFSATPFDNGHEFDTSKWVELSSHRRVQAYGSNNWYFGGPIVIPMWGTYSPVDPVAPSIGSLDLGVGTKFLNSTRPTKSASDLLRTISEYFLARPQIPFQELSKAVNRFRLNRVPNALGSEYLNIVFGWAPTVSDVLKICNAVIDSAAIFEQYLKDAGKSVRRRRETDWVTVDSFSVENENYPLNSWLDSRIYPGYVYNMGIEGGSRRPIRYSMSTEVKYSFSCAWTYFLDEGNTFWEKMDYHVQMADKLLGIKLDADLLYQLAPWSWLLDWFGNLGDIVSLMSDLADDNLVLRYGYLMRETRARQVAKHPGFLFYSGSTGELTHALHYTRKERVRATPYGFSISTGQFTDQQWGILAALGLTKNPKRMMWE